jgi:polysaccharide pyruvyl transferase WcaK-like protein
MTTVDELFAEIACTDMVVASRFHNILCSLLLERPVISLGYHDKNLDLLTTYGLERFCQDIEEFTVQKLQGQFMDCRENNEAIIGGIDRQNREYRRLLAKQYDMLLVKDNLGFRKSFSGGDA